MSRFVSAGTDVDPRPPDDAWVEAQQAVEAQQQQHKPTNQVGQEAGKSLYDVLQQNKGRQQSTIHYFLLFSHLIFSDTIVVV
jgi:hypothetical protein